MEPDEKLGIKQVKKVFKMKFKMKLKILRELNKGDTNISDLSRKTGISYKETHRQVTDLASWGFLVRVRRFYEKHRPVELRLTKDGLAFYHIIK
jgi:DNA-binding HxlR family transcriptional regulator